MKREIVNDLFKMTVDHSHPGYSVFVVEGQDSFETSVGFWKLINEIVLEKGIQQIIVEDKLLGKDELSFSEQANLAKYLSENFKGIRFAYIENVMNDQEVLFFAENFITNRGLTGKIFRTYSEAEQYLLSD